MDKIASGIFYLSHKALRIMNMSTLMYHSISPLDQITDKIYLGDFRAADDKNILLDNGITHIINCARDIPEVYQDTFSYLSLNLRDANSQDLTEAIIVSLKFIENAKKVFIHCKQGVSRSASIVLAYLIKEKDMSYDSALEKVIMKRHCVNPNPGFEAQLRYLEGIWRKGKFID
jgi:protein-tyrosine phosphatase